MDTDYIFNGTVNSNINDAGDFVILCLDYFDGAASAMKRFALGKDVRIGDLVREIRRSFAEPELLHARDKLRMKEFQDWALRQQQLHKSAVALRKAAINFDSVLQNIDMDPYYKARLQERCLWTLLAAMSK